MDKRHLDLAYHMGVPEHAVNLDFVQGLDYALEKYLSALSVNNFRNAIPDHLENRSFYSVGYCVGRAYQLLREGRR